MNLVIPEQSAHYYALDGTPVHSVKCKTKDGMRPTTVKDARELSLYPSVTSILSVINKPQLEAWKISQGIIASLTLPRNKGEDLESFAKRVVLDSKSETAKAADKGTQIHYLAEEHLKGKPIRAAAEILKLFEPLKEWINENVQEIWTAETVLVNVQDGYAGTVDLIGVIKGHGLCCVDFKTTRFKEKAAFYPEWPLQLSAYARAYNQHIDNLISVAVNSDENLDEKPQIKVWEESQDFYYTNFKAALQLWKYLKRYNPGA